MCRQQWRRRPTGICGALLWSVRIVVRGEKEGEKDMEKGNIDDDDEEELDAERKGKDEVCDEKRKQKFKKCRFRDHKKKEAIEVIL